VKSVLVGLVLGCAVSVTAGCRSRDTSGQALPSPSGSGLPAPAIPKLSDLSKADAGAALADDGSGKQRGTGTLHPREEAQLGPKATGVLSKILVNEGDRVRKGQLLFTLDSAQAGLGVDQAKAALSSANITLQAAELDYKRTKELLDRGSIPPATFDQVKSRYDGARAGVQQAQVAVSQAQKMAADNSVSAPFSGIVTAKLKNVGEIATMTPPSVVLIVQDLSTLELRARLPERVLRHVTQGDAIEIKLPALDQNRIVKIRRINPTIDVRTRTVEIVADVDNADGKLRSGMLAEVALLNGTSDAGVASNRAP
jgi:RND family efflux transporter MFP subunit